jgi:hypothetical protein
MSAQDNPLLIPVYMPGGSLGYYGFNGGGPARAERKNQLRALLIRYAGHPTAEAIRAYLNERRENPETVITVSDVEPAIRYLKTL